MSNTLVSIVRYEHPLESVRKAVDLAGALDRLPRGAHVFIKPNIVFWTRSVPFPKWGVVTTTRVIQDMVVLLKERGIEKITIGEGVVTRDPKDTRTPAHAFETLGYGELKKRYGVNFVNVMERPFEKVDLGDGMTLRFSTDIVNSDFVVDLPVMKAHNQTVVSLGIKNLKGTIDIPSRKKCHSADPDRDLNVWVARLADRMPPMCTVYDGIFTAELGPGPDGRMHRSNLVMASADVLAGDLVGAHVLGHDPKNVPHLVHAAANHGRAADLSGITVVGEKIEDVARYHKHNFEYTEETGGSLPVALARQGISGISYRKYDSSMCTYCSGVNGVTLTAIRYAWKGKPFDDVEVLTGKMMKPTPGKNKTILLGKCMYLAHRDNPDINEMIAVKGCPPRPDDILQALRKAGIEADPALFENIDQLVGFYMARYQDKPEFDERFFRVH